MVLCRVQLDLADLESVKKFVEDFRATEKKLSVLINNAGLALNLKDTKRQYTKDNFELTMGTNHIGNVQYFTYFSTLTHSLGRDVASVLTPRSRGRLEARRRLGLASELVRLGLVSVSSSEGLGLGLASVWTCTYLSLTLGGLVA